MEKYPSGSRGSPAKGVVCEECSVGSNPTFSAKVKNRLKMAVFAWFSGILFVAFEFF